MRVFRSAAIVTAMLGMSLLAAAGEAPRAARSVHLSYVCGEGTAYYNELTVEKSVPGSYFMACGFHQGYFGIQEQADGRKVVLFSVWDSSKENDPNVVSEEQRVQTTYKAPDVEVRRFGGEGTGAQSFFHHDWKVGCTYRFLVKAASDATHTAYAAYYFLPESKTWKHLVTFRTRTGGIALRGLYSFIEDFRRDGQSAHEIRRARFGNGWVRRDDRWVPLGKARFTASSASWEAKETIDAGTAQDAFYLQTGGATKRTRALGTLVELSAGRNSVPSLPEN